MCESIVVGVGYSGNSWRSIKRGGPIYANKVSYSIHGRPLWFNFEMTIFKDTAEGTILSRLIEQEQPDEVIDKHLLDVAKRFCTPGAIKAKVEELCTQAYQQGKKDAQAQIRQALESLT